MIPVTKPFLPPIEEYENYISGIWKRNWLTNMGPLANDLEIKLIDHLGVDNLLFVTNGTIALQLAIKALNLKGEIITTPFSFVATSSAIAWEGCTPIYADIDEKTLNIDPGKIEEKITEKTTAIIATHVYGNPCDVKRIEEIALKYNLKVIYDGAHAFGVKVGDQSVFNFGDISICSLHATKLYHSIEGGLIISKDPELIKKCSYMRNFGFNGPENFAELGINGKNSEYHAAMGLANLNYIEQIHQKRKDLTFQYNEKLKNVRARTPEWHSNSSKNFAYYPIVFDDYDLAMSCYHKMIRKEIFARRYFYPSLATSLPYVETQVLPITEDISKRVLCLPLYYDLSKEEVDLICAVILAEDKLSKRA